LAIAELSIFEYGGAKNLPIQSSQRELVDNLLCASFEEVLQDFWREKESTFS
jgi:hypothetical protein